MGGGVAFANGFHARVLSIPAIIIGSSRSDLASKVDAVMALLNPELGLQYLKFDAESDRAWRGSVSGRISRKPKGIVAVEITIPWTCVESAAYSTTETSQTITINANPKTFAVPAAGSVAGSAYALPTWVVKNTSGGTSGALTLQNTTTGEKVSTTAGIANGTWLRFDAARQILETSTDSGSTWAAAMSNRGSYRNIPRLKPGASNSLTLTGLSSGSVVATYRARYL